MQHINPISGYAFHGANAEALTNAMRAHNFGSAEWATATQAKRAGLIIPPTAKPVTITLNTHPFQVFNLDGLKPTGTAFSQAPTPAATPKKAPEALTLRDFKAGMPYGGKGLTAECAAFFNGLPNGGTYVAHTGRLPGDLIYSATRWLADNGDAHGNRYSLQLEQVGLAFYKAFSPKGKLLARPELFDTWNYLEPKTAAGAKQLANARELNMVHPTYRITIKPMKA